MKKTSLQSKPYMRNDAEPRFKSLGALVSIRASTEQTGGAFNLFDVLFPAGYETPLHIHYAEDVAIHVVAGSLDLFWGEERRPAPAGSFFYQPHGMPHGFRLTGTGSAHLLYLTFPAGFDAFVIERSKPLHASEALLLEAHYKLEVLGPLPE
jgi:quercetin dioxygenase-like cupin family protein